MNSLRYTFVSFLLLLAFLPAFGKDGTLRTLSEEYPWRSYSWVDDSVRTTVSRHFLKRNFTLPREVFSAKKSVFSLYWVAQTYYRIYVFRFQERNEYGVRDIVITTDTLFQQKSVMINGVEGKYFDERDSNRTEKRYRDITGIMQSYRYPRYSQYNNLFSILICNITKVEKAKSDTLRRYDRWEEEWEVLGNGEFRRVSRFELSMRWLELSMLPQKSYDLKTERIETSMVRQGFRLPDSVFSPTIDTFYSHGVNRVAPNVRLVLLSNTREYILVSTDSFYQQLSYVRLGKLKKQILMRLMGDSSGNPSRWQQDYRSESYYYNWSFPWRKCCENVEFPFSVFIICYSQGSDSIGHPSLRSEQIKEERWSVDVNGQLTLISEIYPTNKK